MALLNDILKWTAKTAAAAALAFAGLPFTGVGAMAQDRYVVTGMIEWGVYVDPDGCMHWWADGGVEGYMVTRFHPETGRPYCLDVETCATLPAETYFHTDSHQLMPGAEERLRAFFQSEGAFSYAIYGHTDERASIEYNQALSERRAGTVAAVARSAGAVVERVQGFSELRPRAPGHNEGAWHQNRRVDIVCYHLPR